MKRRLPRLSNSSPSKAPEAGTKKACAKNGAKAPYSRGAGRGAFFCNLRPSRIIAAFAVSGAGTPGGCSLGISLYDINGPGIYIDDGGDAVFANQARYCLNVLRSKDLGISLLRDVRNGCTKGKTVVIENPPNGPFGRMAAAIPSLDVSEGFRQRLTQPGNGNINDDAYPHTVRGQEGCSAIVRWAFNDTIPMTTIRRPAFIALAHELIHALHFLTADCPRAPVREMDLSKDSGLAEEEARTCGLGPYSDPDASEAYNENAFRRLYGVVRRDYYTAGIDFSTVRRS